MRKVVCSKKAFKKSSSKAFLLSLIKIKRVTNKALKGVVP